MKQEKDKCICQHITDHSKRHLFTDKTWETTGWCNVKDTVRKQRHKL